MRFSLITLTYNKLPVTSRCLTAILRDTVCDAPWELIVVDNGSTDNSADWIEQHLIPYGAARNVTVRLLRNSENIGCSKARNQGIAAAIGEYLLFLDNDVTPRTRNWLQILLQEHLSDPTIAMVGPKMVYPLPNAPIQCAGVAISPQGRVCFRGRGSSNNDPTYTTPTDVQCLISACLLIPAHLIATHGGFDPVFHPVQFEDFDLCYRLREQGWRARYTPAAEMYHFESTTTQGTSAINNAAVVIRNGLTFKNRWQHMFATEAGPTDTECQWLKLPPLPPLADIPDPLPML
ncbi:MAG: glycosyltransferase family 2 protein [Lentisphaerae bacterium]|jgi:GT2 family glycosyltransferase|nr:glycosyltransferase family 2 protein [Lentisphaerota bacterium]